MEKYVEKKEKKRKYSQFLVLMSINNLLCLSPFHFPKENKKSKTRWREISVRANPNQSAASGFSISPGPRLIVILGQGMITDDEELIRKIHSNRGQGHLPLRRNADVMRSG